MTVMQYRMQIQMKAYRFTVGLSSKSNNVTHVIEVSESSKIERYIYNKQPHIDIATGDKRNIRCVWSLWDQLEV